MHVIDSHTGGMPTRVILKGGPDLGSGSLVEKADVLAGQYRDFYRSLLQAPFAPPAMVGALLVEPDDQSARSGVIFFDADAVLGMCGHGMIGLGVTLAHLDQVKKEQFSIETPAGTIRCRLKDKNTLSFQNIRSFRFRKKVAPDLEKIGPITGDIAYGGNWFFIVEPSPIALRKENIAPLTETALAVREALWSQGICGKDGAKIDHIIFQEESSRPGVDWKNFVLCPDGAFDRSPCGTGSSARLACLAADGRLNPGDILVQESIIGSPFSLSFQEATGQEGAGGCIHPTIEGKAFVMAESRLFFTKEDPFGAGLVTQGALTRQEPGENRKWVGTSQLSVQALLA